MADNKQTACRAGPAAVDNPKEPAYTARTRHRHGAAGTKYKCSGHDPGALAPILWNSTAAFA
ncbi:MAG: hypothetical protein JJT95_10280 [Pararhodobacter sp.]|nr:hypothetical protein [Pararhodobacter sp.]